MPKDSVVDSKPQLEIFADDVKAPTATISVAPFKY